MRNMTPLSSAGWQSDVESIARVAIGREAGGWLASDDREVQVWYEKGMIYDGEIRMRMSWQKLRSIIVGSIGQMAYEQPSSG
jgi:hypothetical protein